MRGQFLQSHFVVVVQPELAIVDEEGVKLRPYLKRKTPWEAGSFREMTRVGPALRTRDGR